MEAFCCFFSVVAALPVEQSVFLGQDDFQAG